MSQPAIISPPLFICWNRREDSKSISRPMVFTSNNKKAIIASGQEIPVPVSTLSNAERRASTQRRGRGRIEHSIQEGRAATRSGSLDQFGERSVARYFAKDRQRRCRKYHEHRWQSSPDDRTRYIRSTVSARLTDATIILGGLIQDNKGRSYTGIPILSRIPGIGALFRSTENVSILGRS